ncbi:MAG: hypothetical protein U0269_16990 [Polyangiales bacterium]
MARSTFTLALALALSACVRTPPSPSVTAQPQRTTAARTNDASASRAAELRDGGEPDARFEYDHDAAGPMLGAAWAQASVPPLFAHKINCLDPNGARAFARHPRGDGGQATRVELTIDEVRARPWLWGQYPSGCTGMGMGWNVQRSPDGGARATIDRALIDGPVRQRVLAVAENYLGWGRVDDYQRWAPFDCMLPPSSRPQADLAPSAPHGRKVYFLYALDRRAYLQHDDVAEQIIVKEAWVPQAVPMNEAISSSYPAICARESEGMCVQPGAFNGLFVMLRGAVTTETDQGWTYATVNPSGEITAMGRIQQCMRCHQRAPHGRLFGIASNAGVRWH